ncbi:DUF2194 domain-containing protein [Candidatus Kryptonium thompsonii]|nr:DUF2194 domain-containing protein [Candidatus Kryptonium thompsoni]
MPRSLFNMIFMVCFFLFASCKTQKEKIDFSIEKPEKVLLIYDSSDMYSSECVENARWAFKYAKVNYDELDLLDYQGKLVQDFQNYYAIVFATEFIKKLSKDDCQRIKNFVANGGGLAVIYRGYNENLSELFGVKLRDARNLFLKRGNSGLVFNANLMPMLKNTAIPDSILRDLSMFDFIHFGSKSIIATSSDKIPVVWQLRYGLGKVIYWNTSILVNKLLRGFITRSIISVSDKFVQPISNLAVIFIDDFPTAVPNVKKKLIWDEFNMTMAEYHFFIFYPDMVKLADEIGLKYTAGLTFNYGADIKPPFHLTEWRVGKVKVFDKEVEVSKSIARQFKSKNELAFHGYNHISLLVDEWKDIENMKSALRFAQKKWEEEGLGKLPITYIPPTNWIDSIGVQAIVQSFPSIKVIAGLYSGFFDVGQSREFGPEPWNRKLYCIPRVSAGFLIDDYTKLLILSEVAMLGVWTHFIHPDDVIYTPDEVENPELVRNWFYLPWRGKNGEGLYFKFKEWLKDFKKNYPYIRFMTCAEAYEEMQKFDNLMIEYEFFEDEIRIKTNQKEVFLVADIDAKYKGVELTNAVIVHSGVTDFTNFVVLKTLDNSVILKLR